METALLESRIRFMTLFKLILDEWEDLNDLLPSGSPECVNLDTLSDDTWLQQFRFTRSEVSTLVEALDLPDVVECPQSGIKEDRVTALCMLLRRLAYPNRLVELEMQFGQEASRIS
ncbi:DDE Tnp4 domain-containing protein [Mycena sanguinolenta]|uniref:DDE Tnp4 domain-containing protein n=1 Tax=Mycena sanguinolenta TaxID=230812 RepID=A0A8H6ZJ32_9AGAR|nr:DDE Tnp4 domain-containing protein [Mycena sanguinolenta]